MLLSWRTTSEPKFRPLWQRHLLDRDSSSSGGGLFKSLLPVMDSESQRKQQSTTTRKLHQMAAVFFLLLFTLAIVKESLVSFHTFVFSALLKNDVTLSAVAASGGGDSDNDAPTAAPSPQVLLINDATLDEIAMPSDLRYLANTFEPFEPNDRLVLVKIPRTGITMMEQILARCFGQVVAAQYRPPGSDLMLPSETITTPNNLEIITQKNGEQLWNVDLSTMEGIAKSKELQLVYQVQARVFISPHLYEVSMHLMNDQHRGRVFMMFRHPIERLVSLFYHLEKEDQLPKNTVTMQDFVKHNVTSISHNIYTRQLCHKTGYGDVLTPEDEKLARRVLRDKVIIGLVTDKDESLRRLEQTFQWSVDRPQVEQCHERLLNWDWPLKNRHAALSPEKEVYKSMERKNALDMKLFAYAQVLFRQQAVLFPVE